MNTFQESEFREALAQADIPKAQEVCEAARREQETQTLADLSVSIFLIRLERNLLARTLHESQIHLPEILEAVADKTIQAIRNIVEASNDREANMSRTKAQRYTEAELLLKMIIDGNWETTLWHNKTLMNRAFMSMIKNAPKKTQAFEAAPEILDDPLEVSWDGDEDYQDDKESSGEHRRLSLSNA